MYSAIEPAQAVVSVNRASFNRTESTREESEDDTPTTLVVQANRHITQENSAFFQQVIENALDVAIEGVIVDLLWLEETDVTGVAALIAATEKASMLGKILTFQSMSPQIRLAVESEWERLRQKRFQSWSDRFDQKLETFLGRRRKG